MNRKGGSSLEHADPDSWEMSDATVLPQIILF